LKNRLLRQPLCGGKSPRESRYPHQMQSSNARFRSNRFEVRGRGCKFAAKTGEHAFRDRMSSVWTACSQALGANI
jgi:hypothetical protein